MQAQFTVWNDSRRRDKSYTVKLTPTENNEWPIFLVNEAGEGMSISEKDLFYMFDEHFKKEF